LGAQAFKIRNKMRNNRLSKFRQIRVTKKTRNKMRDLINKEPKSKQQMFKGISIVI